MEGAFRGVTMPEGSLGLWSQADPDAKQFYVPNGAWVIMGGNWLCTYYPGLATITFNVLSVK